eukprot:1137877-Pelagomonas_calceolata.AAC.2
MSGCARPWGAVNAPAVMAFQKPSLFYFQPATLQKPGRCTSILTKHLKLLWNVTWLQFRIIKAIDQISTRICPVYKKPLLLAISLLFPCQNRGPGSDFPDPRPSPPDPPECAPDELPSHRCWSGQPGGGFLRTPFWQGFCLIPGPTPWAARGRN